MHPQARPARTSARIGRIVCAVLLAAIVAGCVPRGTDEPGRADAAPTLDWLAIERDRPDCSDHIALFPGRFLDEGRIPDPQRSPVLSFLYKISNSTWCASVTSEDLVETARALVISYPAVCAGSAPGLDPEVIAFIDARTAGGPVAAAYNGMEMGMGRSGVYLQFLAAVGAVFC
ncbi:hypothetical protein [Nocardia sp. NPDC051832]|uniref:hypothetical protein n=1 Tax=Nocardia sp. NPDC051832 TaxID=3155673 RepID=UPI0034371BF7